MEPAWKRCSSPAGLCQHSDTKQQLGKSQQAKVLIMQLLVQLQLQVFLHNQADKYQIFSGVASHPKWCSQKSERRQMISRKPSRKRGIVWLGKGQAMQRLWPWCTLQTQNTSDDCHSLALYTEMAPRQLQTQISPGKPSMHGSIEMAWGHLQTSCSNGKGSNLCWVQLFGKKKYYFINQPPPETTVLLSPQTVTAFCSSEILFLVCFCSWRGQGLALNKKEDLKHPLKSCWSVTLNFKGKQGGF